MCAPVLLQKPREHCLRCATNDKSRSPRRTLRATMLNIPDVCKGELFIAPLTRNAHIGAKIALTYRCSEVDVVNNAMRGWLYRNRGALACDALACLLRNRLRLHMKYRLLRPLIAARTAFRFARNCRISQLYRRRAQLLQAEVHVAHVVLVIAAQLDHADKRISHIITRLGARLDHQHAVRSAKLSALFCRNTRRGDFYCSQVDLVANQNLDDIFSAGKLVQLRQPVMQLVERVRLCHVVHKKRAVRIPEEVWHQRRVHFLAGLDVSHEKPTVASLACQTVAYPCRRCPARPARRQCQSWCENSRSRTFAASPL